MTFTLVQSSSAVGGAGSATVTATFGASTTAGNLVIAVMGWQKQTVSSDITGVTLGGSADNFAEAAEQVSFQSPWSVGAAIWYDPNCASGQTAVVASGTGVDFSIGGVAVYEFSGAAAAPLDQVAKAQVASGQTTWSSGNTAAIADADELYIGAFEIWNIVNAATAPGFTTIALPAVNGQLLSGYQISTDPASSTPAYSGSQPTQAGVDAAAIATFKPASGVVEMPGGVTLRQSLAQAVTLSQEQAGTVSLERFP